MSIDEDLSRLLSGDLPEEEARALRERVAAEPELAARLAELAELVAALEALPDAMTPRPLRTRPAAPRARSRALAWAGWAAAAATLVAWLLPSAEPVRVLESGVEWVDGEALLLAGDVRIEVDGRARIFVEPPRGVVRGAGHDREESMDKKSILAALAGSAVTVAVYQGAAVVWAEGRAGAPVTVSAGETHVVRPAGGAEAPHPKTGGPTPELARDVERLTAELDQARARLAEAEFAGALARGQLAAREGVPSAWPADVPEPMRRENFEVELEKRLEGLAGYEVSHVDCDEYPCVAAIRHVGEEGARWEEPLQERIGGWTKEVMGEGLSLSVNTSKFDHDGNVSRFVLFGAYDGGRDSDVGVRTDHRIDALVDQIGQEVAEEGEAGGR